MLRPSEEQSATTGFARIVGLSHTEIAAPLGKTGEACRHVVRRALAKLSIALGKRAISF